MGSDSSSSTIELSNSDEALRRRGDDPNFYSQTSRPEIEYPTIDLFDDYDDLAMETDSLIRRLGWEVLEKNIFGGQVSELMKEHCELFRQLYLRSVEGGHKCYLQVLRHDVHNTLFMAYESHLQICNISPHALQKHFDYVRDKWQGLLDHEGKPKTPFTQLDYPSAMDSFDAITDRAKNKKIAMFLDYDGTLSPIVDEPDSALSEAKSDVQMRATVSNVAKYFPTAIISGRSRDKRRDPPHFDEETMNGFREHRPIGRHEILGRSINMMRDDPFISSYDKERQKGLQALNQHNSSIDRWSFLDVDVIEAKNENLLPISQRDRVKVTIHGARNSKAFLQYWNGMLTNISPTMLPIPLATLLKLLYDQIQNLSADPFHNVTHFIGNSNTTLEVSLTLNEAFAKTLPDMMQMNMFITIWVGILILTKPLPFKWPIMTMALLAPVYYFSILLAGAPHFSVICGTLKMPIFWFAFLGALGFSLLQAFVMNVVLYLSWRYMQ